MGEVYGERWEIIESLKEAGQAWTYEVKDIHGEYRETCVLKRLKNPKRLGRFEQEVDALGKLAHEGIAKLVDFDLENGRPWFVQEFYREGDLEDYVKGLGGIEVGRAFDFFIQLCDALAYAHGEGTVHRDVKPANVFLKSKNGPAVLGDFGLCWVEDSGERLTLTTEAVGSFHYMAPELGDGRLEEPDWRCDIYSLGKVLYFMLSNGQSFDREVHREDDRNVAFLRKNLYMEHANLILDRMIDQEPENRSPADELGEAAREARRLTLNEFAPLDGAKYAPCKYCGIGSYQPKLLDDDHLSFFGIHPQSGFGQKGWRALVCDHCGNIQFFRMDMAEKDWFPDSD